MAMQLWDDLQKRIDELSNQLLAASLDNNKRHLLQKEHSYLSTLLTKKKEIDRIAGQIEDLKLQKSNAEDPEFAQLYQDEIVDYESQLKKEQESLDKLMYPTDPLDDSSIFLEIRAGAGGQEASLFAADLMKMYTNYGLKKGWHVSVASASETDLGGFREVILHIEGDDVYGHLKYESGVHRVQRVPATETQGRVHTSTATVAILPEPKEVDITINPADLRIDVYRAGGAGGQHVNKTDSAVRITHIPTGVVVACQDERSQHKNKAKAMKILQARISAAEKEKQQSAISQQRKELVGSGMRAEKVRTYNFPQNRITDHQVDLTLKKLDYVIEGDLDEIIDALRAKDLEDRRKRPLVF